MKSRQSGSRTYHLNLCFVIDGCCSTIFCGMTHFESPWTPALPARASQQCPHYFIFHHLTLPQAPSRPHSLGQGPSCWSSFVWQGQGASPELGHLTGLPSSPGSLGELTHVTHRRGLSYLSSYWWRQILMQYVWSEAWDSAFLIISQMMLLWLVCGWILRGQELGQHNLLPELSCPTLYLQLISSTL